MSLKIEVGGHGARLTIEVLGYENPAARDISDANWLSCRVVVKLGPFFGDLNASFTTHDFVRFLEEIRVALSQLRGSASFLTDEDALRLNLELERTGRARISGVAQVFDYPQAALSFSFESDQSFLGQMCRELEAVVRQFPVRDQGSIPKK